MQPINGIERDPLHITVCGPTLRMSDIPAPSASRQRKALKLWRNGAKSGEIKLGIFTLRPLESPVAMPQVWVFTLIQPEVTGAYFVADENATINADTLNLSLQLLCGWSPDQAHDLVEHVEAERGRPRIVSMLTPTGYVPTEILMQMGALSHDLANALLGSTEPNAPTKQRSAVDFDYTTATAQA